MRKYLSMHHYPISVSLVILFLSTACSKGPVGDLSIFLSTPDLVAFWTFGEEPGEQRVSVGGSQTHSLSEVGGPIARADVGPFSGYSAYLDGRQYLSIPYQETGDLNICGPNAQVSMFAVVKIHDLEQSRTIAGMWSEGKGKDDDTGTRQYAMLMNMPTYGGPRQLVPHISAEGGVTMRADSTKFPWCADYAATKQEVPEERWCTLAFTYDGKYIKAYIDGVFEERMPDPASDKREDPYFMQEGPGGGNRGMNPYYHGRGIFCYDETLHGQTKPDGGSAFTVGARYAVGSMLKEATIGYFGGLAVFDRALTDEEILKLHEASHIEQLK
ncbi:LamG domain-containing protein [Imperialibacter roseus]|uniref:LamG domain-containing protein n=1 Tax=Imperialibacter roseus TaxID=1324217 RepID=A0ABZ0IY10_9BACT|nr:LamG domain-containing protein [Imperialibacter roseus]WOK08542.1 LamG domain-containing protein [Imperialibacter roseus]